MHLPVSKRQEIEAFVAEAIVVPRQCISGNHRIVVHSIFRENVLGGVDAAEKMSGNEIFSISTLYCVHVFSIFAKALFVFGISMHFVRMRFWSVFHGCWWMLCLQNVRLASVLRNENYLWYENEIIYDVELIYSGTTLKRETFYLWAFI